MESTNAFNSTNSFLSRFALPSFQPNNKQLLDEVFAISGIIKVEVTTMYNKTIYWCQVCMEV